MVDQIKRTPHWDQLSNEGRQFLRGLVAAAGFNANDYDPGEWVELLDEFAGVAQRFREWADLRDRVIYRGGTSTRIRELLEANNREVARRRAAVGTLRRVTEAIDGMDCCCPDIEPLQKTVEAGLIADEEAGRNEPQPSHHVRKT